MLNAFHFHLKAFQYIVEAFLDRFRCIFVTGIDDGDHNDDHHADTNADYDDDADDRDADDIDDANTADCMMTVTMAMMMMI